MKYCLTVVSYCTHIDTLFILVTLYWPTDVAWTTLIGQALDKGATIATSKSLVWLEQESKPLSTRQGMNAIDLLHAICTNTLISCEIFSNVKCMQNESRNFPK